MTQKNVTILGSTGSVGQNTVNLIGAHPDKFAVTALTAGKNVNLLIQQARLLQPDMVAIADETAYKHLKSELSGSPIVITAGTTGILEAASLQTDLTIAAIVGFAGLAPLMQALQNAKTVAIANKEPLVAAGRFVMDIAKKNNVTILPVDSEHNAIFQVLEKRNYDQIKRIILTASGGPFRTWTIDKMNEATPEQAINHPNWVMGAKISVDSASMMNKALEIIEAHYLFAMPSTKIDVLIHPQSVIHSMVEYSDGSTLAQLGAPDMRTPIAYALAYPQRITTTGQTLDWATLSTLTFEKPDTVKFPALRLAYECLNSGEAACIAFNAANEVAVARFLEKKINFGDIITTIDKGLKLSTSPSLNSIDDIVAFDRFVRESLKG